MPIHFYSACLQGLPPPLSFLLFSMSCEANPSGWLIWTPSLHRYLSTGVSQGVTPQGVIISWCFACCLLLNSATWHAHISPRTLATHRGVLSCFSSHWILGALLFCSHLDYGHGDGLLSLACRWLCWFAFIFINSFVFLRSLCLHIVSVELSHLDWQCSLWDPKFI